ncbi:MAG: hypothetical protein WAU75_03100 [Solirubrobacteraceae bacterium]
MSDGPEAGSTYSTEQLARSVREPEATRVHVAPALKKPALAVNFTGPMGVLDGAGPASSTVAVHVSVPNAELAEVVQETDMLVGRALPGGGSVGEGGQVDGPPEVRKSKIGPEWPLLSVNVPESVLPSALIVSVSVDV